MFKNLNQTISIIVLVVINLFTFKYFLSALFPQDSHSPFTKQLKMLANYLDDETE